MPTIRYFNQSAPFWDFIASLEEQLADSPLFNDSTNNPTNDNESGETLKGEEKASCSTKEADTSKESPCCGPKGSCCGKDSCGNFKGFSPRGHCGPKSRFHHRGRGPFGPIGANPAAFCGGFPFDAGSFGCPTPNTNTTKNEDHHPPADIFSTPSAYVIHISLPGAKKEDVGLNWNSDKSELTVAGVIYRPGDEEFLKTLALDERNVGAFEKKVRLGNERYPAKVDEEGITAKLEDGVLIVTILKLDKEGYVEVKKVDIE